MNENNYEYVIVNLTIQLEKKLKAKYGNGIQLLDMIDSAYNDSIINDLAKISGVNTINIIASNTDTMG